MTYSHNTLTKAKRQIDSTIHKLKETVKTLESKENPSRYKSQITLAARRYMVRRYQHDTIHYGFSGMLTVAFSIVNIVRK